MTDEETTETNRNPAHESAGDREAGQQGFEIPECCRQIMAQMMGSCPGHPGKDGGERPAEDESDSPGMLGRLILRMMKACCGRPQAKQSSSAQF